MYFLLVFCLNGFNKYISVLVGELVDLAVYDREVVALLFTRSTVVGVSCCFVGSGNVVKVESVIVLTAL